MAGKGDEKQEKERLFVLQNKASVNLMAPNKKRIKVKKGATIKTKNEKMANFLLSHWFTEVTTDEIDSDGKGEE